MTLPNADDLGSLIVELGTRFRERRALVMDDRVMTYEQLDAESSRVACALMDHGVARGDRVAILSPNCPEWVVSLFGVAKAGATLVALSTWSSSDRIRAALEHAQPKVLIYASAFLRRDYDRELMSALDERPLPQLARLLRLPSPDGPGSRALQAAAVEDWDAFMAVSSAAPPASRSEPLGPACMLYTSGTTGDPKPVVLRHDGLVANGYHIGERLGLDASDATLLSAPLCFAYGLIQALLASLTHGATVVIMRQFDPDEAARSIEAHGITTLVCFGQTVRALSETASFRDGGLRSLRKGRVGHARADLEIAMDELGMDKVCLGYGLSETYGACALTRSTDDRDVRLDGWLEPLPNFEICVVDASGQEVGTGAEGEIRVRGYGPPGYFGDAEQNARAFDDLGFLRTGDIGVKRPDGRIKFAGRVKELIKSGGMNIVPRVVEAALLAHPMAADACVVGVGDERLGETAMAVVHVVGPVTEQDLLQWCRGRLSAYEVPRRIVLMEEELPRLGTGKIDRAAVRASVALLASVLEP